MRRDGKVALKDLRRFLKKVPAVQTERSTLASLTDDLRTLGLDMIRGGGALAGAAWLTAANNDGHAKPLAIVFFIAIGVTTPGFVFRFFPHIKRKWGRQ